MPRGLMEIGLFKRSELTCFKAFATAKGPANEAAEVSEDGTVDKAGTSASWRVRKNGSSSIAQTAIQINNKVRDQLVDALKLEFSANTFNDLPKKVKAALRGTFARTGAGDFDFGTNGESRSGKPLTRRRIMAVLKAATAVKKAMAAEKKEAIGVKNTNQKARGMIDLSNNIPIRGSCGEASLGNGFLADD